jgi:hypothetical protein
MLSESVRKAILSNPGISSAEKAKYRTSSSSGGSSNVFSTPIRDSKGNFLIKNKIKINKFLEIYSG